MHPDFRAIFTSNPTEYAGVHRAADALQDRMITVRLGYYDRQTEIAITVAKSGIDRRSAAKIVDIVRGLRDYHEDNKANHDICPTVRSSIMIATVLKTYGARPKPDDDGFVALCHDVLNSSRWDEQAARGLTAKVDALIRKHAA